MGMCGGVITSLSFGIPAGKQPTPFLLLYNIGRLFSYFVAGCIVGWLGSHLSSITEDSLTFLRLLSSLFIIATGFYIGKWWTGILVLERIGKPIWAQISKLNRFVMPINTYPKAISYGMIWGWLPCGLVYSTLTWSITAGSTIGGGLIMLCFGLGTLPAVLSLGSLSQHLANTLKTKMFKNIASIYLILWGLYVFSIEAKALLA